jgi:hypothetical protein
LAVEAPRPWTAAAGPSLSPSTPSSPDLTRVPTGIADFDHLSGGIPAGSVVLLWGEPGSGHQEFALTSAAHLMLTSDEPTLPRTFLGPWPGPFRIPRGIAYVSTSRSQEQLHAEVDGAFDETYRSVLRRHLKFHDLSPAYFVDSVVPSGWTTVGRSLLGGTTTPPGGGTGPLGALAHAIEADAPNNLVIVDCWSERASTGRSSVPSSRGCAVTRRRGEAWSTCS